MTCEGRNGQDICSSAGDELLHSGRQLGLFYSWAVVVRRTDMSAAYCTWNPQDGRPRNTTIGPCSWDLGGGGGTYDRSAGGVRLNRRYN